MVLILQLYSFARALLSGVCSLYFIVGDVLMDDQLKKKLKTLKQGHHACLFYDDPAAACAITAEYIKAGLRNNEQCVYMADPPAITALTLMLNPEIDVEKEMKRGALHLTSVRGHLDSGQFNTAKMIGFLEKGVESALSSGFSGLRATGDVVWELGDHVDMELLSHYEVCLDHFFFGKKLTGLCQYNCKVVSSDYLRRSLMCHNAVVLEEKVALHNPYHNFPLPSIAPPLNRMLTGLT